jgi:hypothetical protein
MPSRLWLAAAFVVALGPSPARAETDLIAVRLDQAMIADVTMLFDGHRQLGFGQTNLIAIAATGSIPGPTGENRAGPAERRSPMRAIPNACRRFKLCDDKSFAEAGGQITARDVYATGRAASAPAK